MARDPQAIAKALIRANTPTGMQPGAGGFGGPPSTVPGGMSPLVASYGEWASGRNAGRGLPRSWETFASGSFGPLVPMLPMPIDTPEPGEDQAPPRRWQYPPSWNIPHGAPGDEGLKLAPFSALRVIGDTYSVARACIKVRKDELLGLGWDITPTEAAEKAMRGDAGARKDFEDRRAKLVKFFRRPDTNYFSFRDWFSVLLEDVLVIDALSVYLWPTRQKGKGVLGSDLSELAAIDGSLIRPLVDIHGSRPRPPAPAFQSYQYGVPRVDLMTVLAEQDIEGMSDAKVREYRGDQLIYRPQNPRDWTPYGYACIEQALVPILSGIQRQRFQLDYFDQGSIPGLFVTNGDKESTPQQNRELQDALNAMAGDSAWKHKIIVLPGGSNAMPQHPAELAGTFDEIIQTQVCMAFSVMPMELGITPRASTSAPSGGAHNQMGKLSSDVMERKANLPMLEWFSDIFNHIIQGVCGQHDMRWWWEGLEKDEDAATKSNILKEKVSIGLMSLDEARVEDGRQPWGLPNTSEPVLITPTGVIPFGAIDPSTGQPEGLTPKLTAAPPPPGAGPPGKPPQGGTGGTPAKTPTKPKPTSGPAGAKPAGTPAHAAARQQQTVDKPAGQKPAQPEDKAEKAVPVHAALRELDLIRRRLGKGRGIGGWVPEHIPGNLFEALQADLAKVGPNIEAAAVEKARIALKAVGHRQRRTEAISSAERSVVDGLRGLAAGVGAGTVSTMAFIDRGVHVLRDAIRAALAAGVAHALDTPMVGKTSPTGSFNSRYGLYAGQVNQAYEQGYGLATLGAVDDPDNIVVRWHHREGACELCTARADEEFTVGTLPGWPGDGTFGEMCDGGPNCRCHLSYETVTPQEAARRLPGQPSASGTDRARDAQRQTAADTAAVRRALTSPAPRPALAEVLDGIAERKAEQQRPYLAGLLRDILTAVGRATGKPAPVDVTRPAAGPAGTSGWLSGAVVGTLIAAAVAAAIAAQVQSQQQAAPATVGTQPAEPVTKGKKRPKGRPVAAGLAVRADDTGRILMLQRAWSEDDNNAGMWEMPGGRLEDGESPLDAARREWSEETGCRVPDGQIVGQWIGGKGRYQGFVLAVPSEDDVPIFTGRDAVENPDNDDPDGDPIEAIAWWDPDHLKDNPAVRDELRDSIGEVLDAVEKTLAPGLMKVDAGPVGDYRARHLHAYWTRGEGLARWINSPHPWTALYRGLLEYIHDPDEAKRTASQWFHDATGMWSGERQGKNPVGPG